jgi:hypothetical protein
VRRFIVVTNSATTSREARNAITTYLQLGGWLVWHWFEDLWMVVAPEHVKLGEVRDQITKLLGPSTANVMVMSTEGLIDHAGMVPVNSISWIQENWQR